MNVDRWSEVLNLFSVIGIPIVTMALGYGIYTVNNVRELAGKQEIERLKNENLKLSIQLEDLKQRVSSRMLSAQERTALETMKQGGSLMIVRLGDHEAHQYATEIGEAAAKGGFRVTYADIGVVSPPPVGLQMRSDQQDKDEAKAIVSAGLMVDFKPMLAVPGSLARNGFTILLVGLKRPKI